MAGDEEIIELDEEVKKDSRLDLILKELKHISLILGAINQNINKQLEPMKQDIELCKVNLGKIRRMGPAEVKITDSPKIPESYAPPGQ